MRAHEQHCPAGVVRQIVTDEDPSLRRVSDPVGATDPSLCQHIADLAATLDDFRARLGFGRAISAPQVGIMKRLIIMNLGAGPVALINPTITDRSVETQMVWDDCLSVPGRLVRVERSRSISLRYQDQAGRTIAWDGLGADMAELLQHECDHLDGVLMTDRAVARDAIRPLEERPKLVPALGDVPQRITAAGIAARASEVDPVFARSPQYYCEPLSEELGCNVFLKVETLNPIRCFKGRGASVLIADHRARLGAEMHVVTASAGNWGQAVAYSCRASGVPVTVFAAESANPAKLDRMRSLGAEVVLNGADFDEAKLAAKAFAKERSWRFVEDSQDELITEGHGSIAIELTDGLRATDDHIDAVLVPIGNGAMVAGIGCWMKAASPATEIVGVTALGAPAMRNAWLHPDHRSRWGGDPVDTIADGLAVRIPIDDAVDDVNRVTDEVLEVSDGDIAAAMALLHQQAGLVTEPSGAAGIAALARHRDRFADRRVAVIISGSNISPAQTPLLS